MIHRAAVVVLLMSAAASAQDWPQWRGPNRDGKVSGFQPPAAWPKDLERGWQVEVGGGHSTPALVDGRLYVHARRGDDEIVLCLDAATGKDIWKDVLAVPYTPDPSAKSHGKGPFSSPSVADGKVFTFGISGILSCLDAKSGRVIWRKPTGGKYAEWGTGLSPLVHDGACIVHGGGKEGGAVVAYDAATGNPRWSWEGDGPAYSSPVAAGGGKQIITQTQSSAIGLAAADGKLLWRLEWKTSYDQNSVTPVIAGDLVILSGTKLGTRAIKPPAPAWETTDVSMYMSTGVLKGDRLYGFSERRSGQFFCIDAKTGGTKWTADARQGENAALVDAGAVFFGLTNKAQLVVFDADDKAYVERARYKVSETATWAHPVISGRALFIKDLNTLTRWNLP